jgi:CRP-like cAMP-binding protein
VQDRAKRSITAPLRHRDVKTLAGALAISQTGDWLYNVALLVFVLKQTNSPAWVAAAGVVRLLPVVMLGPFGGVAADRYPRRRVMIASDLIRSVIMLGMFAVTLTHGTDAGASKTAAAAAILLAGLTTSFGVAYQPSVNAAIPVLVDEDELSATNAVFSMIANVSIFVGPAIGAVLLLRGIPVAFAFNAVTFCLSALLVTRIKGDLGPLKLERSQAESGGEAEERASFFEELKQGIGAVTSSKDVVVLVGAWSADSFIYGMQIVLFTLIATELLGTGESGISLLYAASGIGGLIGAVIANWAASRPRQGGMVGWATAGAGIVLIAFVATNGMPVAGYTLAAVDGIATIVIDVLILTSLQRMLGNEVLGRAFGAIDASVFAGMIVGSIVAPILVSLTNLRGALVIGGTLVTAVGLLVLQRARAIDRVAAERAERLAPRVDLIDGLNIFDGASRATLEALAGEITDEHVDAGTVVIREGDDPDDLFVAVSGRLIVTAEGRGQVGELGAGDYFGEIGLLRRIPRTATVSAATDCELYRIPGEEFLRIVNEGGQVSGGLMGSVQARLAVTRPAIREE